jgi:hypothetical protein
MTLINGRMVELLAELERATSRIIEEHYERDAKGENVLRHYGPFRVEVHGIDGHLASFMEEGIDIYPKRGDS